MITRPLNVLVLTVVQLLCTSILAADECPPQNPYLSGSCLKAPQIKSYDDFRNIVEAASSGDKVCFSGFRVSVNETAEPTIISQDVHILCESSNSCVFEGGDTVIRLNGRKAKTIIQGFTFTKAVQPVTIAKGKEKGKRQKICHCNFLMASESNGKRGSAIGALDNANVFVGHCNFRDNQNDKQGGAIYNVGYLSVYKSTFSHNTAKWTGGAIMNKAAATIELQDCSFTGNSALEGPPVHVQGGYSSVKKNSGNEATDNVGCNGIFYEGYGCTEFAGSTPTTPVPNNSSEVFGAANLADDRCNDYAGLKFYTNGQQKGCNWLAGEGTRARQFCSGPGEEGTKTLADALCPKTCKKCSSECADSSASFKRNQNGDEKNCEYLRDPKKGETRTRRYCSTEPGINTNADAACPVSCNKCHHSSISQDNMDPRISGDEIGEDSEETSGSPSPPTPFPTTSPTASPTDFVSEWQTNPIPSYPRKGYFNYNPNDSRYGPDGWKTMRPDEVRQTLEHKYWKEFQNEINEHVDLDHNYCGEETYKQFGYIQSPIDVNDADADGECHEYHQVRDEPGNYRLDDDAVEMQILPSKLRIKWPRTFDKFACPIAGNETDVKCPPSADIPKSWGSHLPVIHADFKMPSEHTLNGKRYAGEYQIWHWQSRGRGAPVVNILVDVPDVPGDEETEREYHNAYFQIAIDEWNKAFISQGECMAKKDPNLDRVDHEDKHSKKSTSDSRHDRDRSEKQPIPGPTSNNEEESGGDHGGRHDKPPGLRGLSHPENTKGDVHFNPYDSNLMPSIWFYGYDRVGLTEPPCTPIASYHVVDTPMKISTKQHRELQHMLFAHVDPDLTDDDCTPTGVHFDGSVARPTQELGIGRELHRCTCRNFYSDKFRKKTGLRDCDDSF